MAYLDHPSDRAHLEAIRQNAAAATALAHSISTGILAALKSDSILRLSNLLPYGETTGCPRQRKITAA
jgi:hypothetical protein